MEKTLPRHTSYIKWANSSIVKRQDFDRRQMPRTLRTALPRSEPESKPVDSNRYILRLERNNKTLLRLRRKLASYLYEPRTRELFDRIEYLKGHIESVSTKNSEIIGFLKHHRQSIGDYLDFIKHASSNFYELKLEIEQYMRDAHVGRPVP